MLIGQDTAPLGQLQDSITRTMMAASPKYCHQLCHLTAAIGAFALRDLTHESWDIGAGSISVRVAEPDNSGFPPWRLEMDFNSAENKAAQAEGRIDEFHAWNILVGDVEPGTVIDESNDHEIIVVDFAAIWWPSSCKEMGVPCNRVDLPAVVCGHPNALAVVKDLAYIPEPGLTQQIIPPNVSSIRALIPLWREIAQQSGLYADDFGQRLHEDILQRCVDGCLTSCKTQTPQETLANA